MDLSRQEEDILKVEKGITRNWRPWLPYIFDNIVFCTLCIHLLFSGSTWLLIVQLFSSVRYNTWKYGVTKIAQFND